MMCSTSILWQHQKAVIVVPPGTDRLGIFPLWDLFELVLGYLGPVLGGSGPVLGLFWAVLGVSWAGLGLSGFSSLKDCPCRRGETDFYYLPRRTSLTTRYP